MRRPPLPLAALLLALAISSGDALRALADDPRPTPPAPPASGWGSDKTPYATVVERVIANSADKDKSVYLFQPAGKDLPKSLPVVLFAHGFGATGPEPYRAWLEHMAKQGTLVVYPVYPGIEASSSPTRYDALWAGLESGIAAFRAADGPKPDVLRMGFVGHSYGGGAVNAIAARAAARGYGAEAMWIECHAPWYDLDRPAWESLPPKALLLAIAYCDDRTCDPSTAQGFIAAATTIPAERKALVVFRSDAHGFPALRADHMTPLTMAGADALDRWGTWRLDDALRAFAVTGAPEAKAFAFGADPAARSLGLWSDGTPVLGPVVGAIPPEGQKKAHRFASGAAFEDIMRKILRFEPHSSLPLPSPDQAPASKLPYSERVCREPPTDWPRAIESAMGQKPLLVVIAGEAKGATVEALDAAEKSIEEKGVKVLRLSTGHPSAKELDPKSEPSVLLFAKGGELRLWKEGEEPNLVPAILDLVK